MGKKKTVLEQAGLSGRDVLGFDFAEEFLPDGVEFALEERVGFELFLNADEGTVHGRVVAVEQFADFSE